jgi:CubicO group peptidase (beta-lactamase class C family)
MKKLSIISLTLIISVAGLAQTIDRIKLDSLFNNLSARNLAIGSIAIMQNGELVYQRSVGQDQNPTATYRIGSITKLFTAVMIYELIDRKKITFEDTLSEFFPGLPNAGKITIADMLGHRSGLANFTAVSTNFDSWKYQPQTHQQLLAFISNQPPDFLPGTKADYNNSNFLLLGYILEKIYHKPYRDIVLERIIHRLGLESTYYGDHAGFQANEAASYKYFDNQWQPEKAVYLDNFAGAGAMISTPQDMCKFIRAVFDGKLISKSSVARMIRIEKDGYGWGMFPFGDSQHKGYGHNGKTEGFASSLQYYPENKLAIAYCTNGEVYPKDDILDKVFKICFTEPCRIPSFTPVILTEQQLQPFTGTYTGDNGLQVTCSVTNGRLVLETKGQQFALEALSDHEFRNVRFGFFFEFDKDGKQIILHDAAVTYWLHKQ